MVNGAVITTTTTTESNPVSLLIIQDAALYNEHVFTLLRNHDRTSCQIIRDPERLINIRAKLYLDSLVIQALCNIILAIENILIEADVGSASIIIPAMLEC